MNLEEKKLTAAELKKREEIAQAIERDDPGMDMSKKMAIATAAAKRVAESDEYTVPKTDREKELAAAAHPKDKITHKDVLVKRKVLKEKGVKETTESKEIVFDDEPIEELSNNVLSSFVNKAVMKPGKLEAAKRAHAKIKERRTFKLAESERDEILEFAIGTTVHHPMLGNKTGKVVRAPHNGFNHAAGVKSHPSDIHVEVHGNDGQTSRVYKFQKHSLKHISDPVQKEEPKKSNISMRKESVELLSRKEIVESVIARVAGVELVEAKELPSLSFKEYTAIFEQTLVEFVDSLEPELVQEGYNDTYKSVIDWSSLGGKKPKYDDDDEDIYGSTTHKAKPAKEPKEKKNVGRPAGSYGSYKIDTGKRNSDVYKAELSAKVRAAKADGFAARKQFKDLMDAAIKKRQLEIAAGK